MTLLWKLLRSHLSVAQTVGFALAGVVGMTIVLTSVQAYRDVMPVFDAPDSFMRGDYLVLSKRVGALQTIGLGSSDFTPGELEELKGQPFVRDVGAFTPANYRVKGTVGMGGVQLSTYLFFESVPDRFLDVGAENWDYKAGDRDIPIIIPRNYLNLYNFGFAQSRSLPKLSEGLMSLVQMDIMMRGNGRVEQYKGNIVGFSNRLNTILVPQSFMDWANKNFAPEKEAEPSRLIVEVKNPTDTAITDYFQQKNYETEGNNLDAGKTTYFLRLITVIVMGVGLFISILSFYILMLSIFLLLQKNTVKLENLLLIGYSPTRVATPYYILTVGLNVLVLLLAIGCVAWVRSYYIEVVQNLFPQLESGSLLPCILTGCLLFFAVSLLNILAIGKKIISIWKGGK